MQRGPRLLAACSALIAFAAVALDHRIGFVDEALAGVDAGAQLALVGFDLGGLTVAARKPLVAVGNGKYLS
jgi:hypothetical protein